MVDVRKQGRPKFGDQQVGRDRIIDGLIEYIRAGYTDISRREIALYLGITPALITYYFPKGYCLLTETVGRQADLWRSKMEQLCAEPSYNAQQRVGLMQQLIIAMYTRDAYIIELQTSLWRAGRMASSVVIDMKKSMRESIAADTSQFDSGSVSLITSIIWGACEHRVRDHASEQHGYLFESVELVAGKLLVCKMKTHSLKLAIGGQSERAGCAT